MTNIVTMKRNMDTAIDRLRNALDEGSVLVMNDQTFKIVDVSGDTVTLSDENDEKQLHTTTIFQIVVDSGAVVLALRPVYVNASEFPPSD